MVQPLLRIFSVETLISGSNMEFIIYSAYAICVATLLAILFCAVMVIFTLFREWLKSRK